MLTRSKLIEVIRQYNVNGYNIDLSNLRKIKVTNGGAVLTFYTERYDDSEKLWHLSCDVNLIGSMFWADDVYSWEDDEGVRLNTRGCVRDGFKELETVSKAVERVKDHMKDLTRVFENDLCITEQEMYLSILQTILENGKINQEKGNESIGL